jgi:hypothetical protein
VRGGKLGYMAETAVLIGGIWLSEWKKGYAKERGSRFKDDVGAHASALVLEMMGEFVGTRSHPSNVAGVLVLYDDWQRLGKKMKR